MIRTTDERKGRGSCLKTKITVEEYQCFKALRKVHAATFLDDDENGEVLDYEDFA